MIPAKEAKDMLYRMLSENLVSLQVRDLQDPGELGVATDEGALGSQRFPRCNSYPGGGHFWALPCGLTWARATHTGKLWGRGILRRREHRDISEEADASTQFPTFLPLHRRFPRLLTMLHPGPFTCTQ